MPIKKKTPVVFYWHMHQPDYRDAITGTYYFPWTYLHGTKDYLDMIAHLEASPDARAVFNLSPILLEQLDDYATNIRNWRQSNEPLRDGLLAALAGETLPAPGSSEFSSLAHNCLRANKKRMIDRFPAFQWLAEAFAELEKSPTHLIYLSPQFLSDLLVWYHLSWMGETVRRNDRLIQQLEKKARGFTWDERRKLVAKIGELMASVIPRYKKLAQEKRIELSINPYSHPILPLLQNFDSTRESMPDVSLPVRSYTGGWERSLWQLERGLETFERFFDYRPVGCWPSEGALSEPTLFALQQKGFLWTASGDSVLRNSIKHPDNRDAITHLLDNDNYLYQHYHFSSVPVHCFFRDDSISDAIGFQYAEWNAEEAVNDLIKRLEKIRHGASESDDIIIPVIMDGENAWEYFHENAFDFLSALYARLSTHDDFQLTTFEDYLIRSQAPVALPKLVAGSWVYGTFSTWIGDADKNKAWLMLVDAKRAVDHLREQGAGITTLQWQAIDHQLALCEGSDWFWWFGDYNPAESVRDFDYLFRRHLHNLYQLMDQTPPDYLDGIIGEGTGDAANGGVMRKGHMLSEGDV